MKIKLIKYKYDKNEDHILFNSKHNDEDDKSGR